MNPFERMQCMEVWGGNAAVDRSFHTTGLDVWVHSRPHAGARYGGDVHYISSCASGRITRLLLADVSGHGESVASEAEALRLLMRQNINYIDQSELATAINRQFAAMTAGGEFATAIIATYFAPRKTLTLSNAGHPNPLIGRSVHGTWSELQSDGVSARARSFPFGIEADESYSRYETSLDPEDLVLCFTDGVIEAKRSDGTMLGLSGLQQIASEIDAPDPAEFFSELIQRLPAPRSNQFDDDRTMILFRRNDQPIALRDNLLAPFRFATDIVGRVARRLAPA